MHTGIVEAWILAEAIFIIAVAIFGMSLRCVVVCDRRALTVQSPVQNHNSANSTTTADQVVRELGWLMSLNSRMRAVGRG
jgi:hypothetical protein